MNRKGIIPVKFRIFNTIKSCCITCIISLHLLISLAGNVQADTDNSLWQALGQKGHVALLRHALAPGTGDPANFSLNDCSTQRNLSEAGRLQAEAIGNRLRKQEIEDVHVYSSQWCRCMETARLLGFAKVEELSLLNSFFREFQRKEMQTKALKDWLAKKSLNAPTVLVTHQVNITALTSIFPQSGELIIVKIIDGHLETLGSIKTPY